MSVPQIKKLLDAGKTAAALDIYNKMPEGGAKTRAGALFGSATVEPAATTDPGAGKTGAGIAPKLKKAGNAIVAYLAKLDNLNVALVKTNASFAANSAAAAKVSAQMMELQVRNVDFGYTLTDLNRTYRELSDNLAARVLPGFEKSAVKLTDQTSRWGRLGVAVGDIHRQVNLFHTSLGMSIERTTHMGRVMNHFARTTGQSFAKVWADFGQNAGRFMDMVDSGRMIRTTLVMQARARSMNMTTGALTDVLDKFETMDSAQETGAKLNTVLSALGGSFDSVKASSMDYADRQEYIAKSLRSVFPRIQAAGPRAARLYMRAIRTTLGMEAKDLQAMMRAQPGGELAGITAMARGGPMAAMGDRQEQRAVRAATTIGQKTGAFKESFANVLALSLRETGIVDLPAATRSMSAKIGTVTSAISNLGTTAGKGFGKEFKQFLNREGWLSKIDDIFAKDGSLDKAFDRIDEFNEKQKKGTATIASSMTDIALAYREIKLIRAFS